MNRRSSFRLRNKNTHTSCYDFTALMIALGSSPRRLGGDTCLMPLVPRWWGSSPAAAVVQVAVCVWIVQLAPLAPLFLFSSPPSSRFHPFTASQVPCSRSGCRCLNSGLHGPDLVACPSHVRVRGHLLTARVVVLLALRHSNWVGKAPTPVTSLMLGSFEPDLVRLASSRCLAESSIADP
jgi:hypothetical protein